MAVEKAFQLKVISYVGTGSAQDITSPGFDPDVILIKKRAPTGTSSLGAFKVRGVDTRVPNVTALQTNAVTAHIANGFSLGTNIAVNESGSTYDAICLAGASSHFDGPFFGYGSYTGDSVDDRDIVVGAQPDFIFLMGADASGDHFGKWSDITGDAAVLHRASAGGESNYIQAINVDGFEVGTNANASPLVYTYFWIRFGTLGLLDELFNADVFNRGAVASGSVTGMAFQPGFVVAKQRANASAYYKTASMGGANNQSWEGSVASSTIGIVAINADGFDYTDAIGWNGQSWYWSFAAAGEIAGSDLVVTTTGGVGLFSEIPGTPVVVDSGVTVEYFDDLGGAIVSIAGGFHPGHDVLDCTDAGDLDFEYDPATGVLLIGGVGSAADYQAALRNVTFDSDGPPLSQVRRRIQFVATTDLIVVNDNTLPMTLPFDL